MFVIYQISYTKAEHAIDGKPHRHKLYLYPTPEHLKDLNINACWERGKKGACVFYSKKLAQEVARRVNGIVEKVICKNNCKDCQYK